MGCHYSHWRLHHFSRWLKRTTDQYNKYRFQVNSQQLNRIFPNFPKFSQVFPLLQFLSVQEIKEAKQGFEATGMAIPLRLFVRDGMKSELWTPQKDGKHMNMWESSLRE